MPQCKRQFYRAATPAERAQHLLNLLRCNGVTPTRRLVAASRLAKWSVKRTLLALEGRGLVVRSTLFGSNESLWGLTQKGLNDVDFRL